MQMECAERHAHTTNFCSMELIKSFMNNLESYNQAKVFGHFVIFVACFLLLPISLLFQAVPFKLSYRQGTWRGIGYGRSLWKLINMLREPSQILNFFSNFCEILASKKALIILKTHVKFYHWKAFCLEDTMKTCLVVVTVITFTR